MSNSLRHWLPVIGGVVGATLLMVGLVVVVNRPVTAEPASVKPAGPDDAERVGSEFPESWYYAERATGRRYAKPMSLEGKAAPELDIGQWVGDPVDLAKMKGKVVVVDFWGTWCPPCMAAIPKNVKMVEHYREEGLMFLGVHDSQRGVEKIPAVMRSRGINYPVGVDNGGRSTRAWKVSFWPTYAVVDRHGVVRAAGLQPGRVEDVVKKLLAEKKKEEAGGEG